MRRYINHGLTNLMYRQRSGRFMVLFCCWWWPTAQRVWTLQIWPHFQAFYYTSSFSSLTVCKNGGRRPGKFHYMIRGTTVICRHASSQQLSDVQDWSCILCYKGLLSDKHETTQRWHSHFMEQNDSTILSCATYIIAIPQRLSFIPEYVLQVGFTSSLALVSVL